LNILPWRETWRHPSWRGHCELVLPSMSRQKAFNVSISSLNVIEKVVKSLSWTGSGDAEHKSGG
jgi:hypothetical protein